MAGHYTAASACGVISILIGTVCPSAAIQVTPQRSGSRLRPMLPAGPMPRSATPAPRGMRQDDGMGRVDRADKLRGGRQGGWANRKQEKREAAAARVGGRHNYKTKRTARRRRVAAAVAAAASPNRCARTPLAAPRRHAQHKGEASNLHKLRPKYDPEGAGSGGSGVRELRRSSGGSYR